PDEISPTVIGRLPPVTGYKDPSTGLSGPMTLHVHGRRSGADDPTTRDPNIIRPSPTPVSLRPDIVRTRCYGLSFYSNGRRRPCNNDFTRRWLRDRAGGNDFTVNLGCCSRSHRHRLLDHTARQYNGSPDDN